MGGVVNVILRRDYRGADFTLTSGISDRGDAARARLEARIGFTPDGGDTDIMLFGSHATSQRLRAGQRDYQRRARQIAFANSPVDYLAPQGSQTLVPSADAIIVQTRDGIPLTFGPQFGGASLNSSFTYLPFNFRDRMPIGAPRSSPMPERSTRSTLRLFGGYAQPPQQSHGDLRAVQPAPPFRAGGGAVRGTASISGTVASSARATIPHRGPAGQFANNPFGQR